RVRPFRYSVREGAHAAVRGGARLGAVAGSAMALTTQATSRGDAHARRHVPLHLPLPSHYDQVSHIDVRALALISLFIVLARVHLAEGATQPAFGGPAVLPLAAILAMLNLGYLAIHLTRDDAWMSSYRELVARIPRSVTVLPIYTGRQE